MQGCVENFFKCFEELKRRYANCELKMDFKHFWVMEVFADNKIIFNLKGNDTNMLFENAASKLFQFLKKNE